MTRPVVASLTGYAILPIPYPACIPSIIVPSAPLRIRPPFGLSPCRISFRQPPHQKLRRKFMLSDNIPHTGSPRPGVGIRHFRPSKSQIFLSIRICAFSPLVTAWSGTGLFHASPCKSIRDTLSHMPMQLSRRKKLSRTKSCPTPSFRKSFSI